jgi:hypothetical protein
MTWIMPGWQGGDAEVFLREPPHGVVTCNCVGRGKDEQTRRGALRAIRGEEAFGLTGETNNELIIGP